MGLLAPAAWANHTFSDVPTASPHHADISAVFGARITGGCAAGLYCPSQPVTRDQMASFLRRGLGRAGASSAAADLALTSTFQTLVSDTITAGGTSGGTGFVIVTGNFTIDPAGIIPTSNRIEYRLVREGFPFDAVSDVGMTTFHPSSGDPMTRGRPTASVSQTWVFPIGTGTARTFSLQARNAFGPNVIHVTTRHLSLLYVPFGSTGASTLGGTQVAGTPPSSSPGGPDTR